MQLVIDTCSRWVLVALIGSEIIKVIESAPRQASGRLISMVRDLLHKSGEKSVQEIIVVNGPGSFTGVRIGVATARNLCQLWNIPGRVVDSLTAYGSSLTGDRLILIDGKQNKYYGRFFLNDQPGMLIDQEWEKYKQSLFPGLTVYIDEPESLKEMAVQPLPAPDPVNIVRAAGEPIRWPDIKPVYLRKDPATARYPQGYRHG